MFCFFQPQLQVAVLLVEPMVKQQLPAQLLLEARRVSRFIVTAGHSQRRSVGPAACHTPAPVLLVLARRPCWPSTSTASLEPGHTHRPAAVSSVQSCIDCSEFRVPRRSAVWGVPRLATTPWYRMIVPRYVFANTIVHADSRLRQKSEC